MISESFLKRILMFIGFILSGLITLIFISTPDALSVPVPDSVPSITTQSSLNREFGEAKQFFESSISAQVPGASLAAIVSWSPSSKYILANLRFPHPEGTTTKPYLLDLTNKQYLEIPNVKWIDAVSWAGTKMAYQTESGYAVYDTATNEAKAFGTAAGAYAPVISSDGSYVAYSENGLVVYSLKAANSIRLTSNKQDIPMLWETDDKTVVLSTAAEPALAAFHIGKKEINKITDLPQPLVRASWVIRGQLALLTLGKDGSYFEYAYDFSTKSLALLAETSEGIAFTSSRDKEIATLKGNRITVFDSHITKQIEAKRADKNRIANFSLLPSPLVLLIREKAAEYDVATFNMKTSVETAIEDIWLPYVIVAPNGRSAVTINQGNDTANFIDIPNV